MTTGAGRSRPGWAGGILAAALALLLGLMPGFPVQADATTPTQSTPTQSTAVPEASSESAGVTADESGAILRPKAVMPASTEADGEAGLSLGKAATLPTIGKTKPTSGTLDFAAWEEMATHSEAQMANSDTLDSTGLDRLRRQ